jgi:hypothetical protein
MTRAYKLPNAAATITEIESAQEVLNDLHARVRELAESIGSGVTALFRRRGFSEVVSDVVLGLQHEGKVTSEGWVYVKTRNAVEPARGAKGDAAREALAALIIPAVQPGTIVEASGMPLAFMDTGRVFRTRWMHHDGALYALLPDESTEFRNDPITGAWVQIPLSELHLADEARLEAGKATAGATD